MKRIASLVLLLVTVAGCKMPDVVAPMPPRLSRERPIVNVPLALRQVNWMVAVQVSRQEQQAFGSCTWAATISLLRWQGRYETADWLRQHAGGGENAEKMAHELDQAGIRYAYVTNGDVKFLEWACRTRRGCGIAIEGGEHMVALVHLDDKWAALLDSNAVESFIWVPREVDCRVAGERRLGGDADLQSGGSVAPVGFVLRSTRNNLPERKP